MVRTPVTTVSTRQPSTSKYTKPTTPQQSGRLFISRLLRKVIRPFKPPYRLLPPHTAKKLLDIKPFAVHNKVHKRVRAAPLRQKGRHLVILPDRLNRVLPRAQPFTLTQFARNVPPSARQKLVQPVLPPLLKERQAAQVVNVNVFDRVYKAHQDKLVRLVKQVSAGQVGNAHQPPPLLKPFAAPVRVRRLKHTYRLPLHLTVVGRLAGRLL